MPDYVAETKEGRNAKGQFVKGNPYAFKPLPNIVGNTLGNVQNAVSTLTNPIDYTIAKIRQKVTGSTGDFATDILSSIDRTLSQINSRLVVDDKKESVIDTTVKDIDTKLTTLNEKLSALIDASEKAALEARERKQTNTESGTKPIAETPTKEGKGIVKELLDDFGEGAAFLAIKSWLSKWSSAGGAAAEAAAAKAASAAGSEVGAVGAGAGAVTRVRKPVSVSKPSATVTDTTESGYEGYDIMGKPLPKVTGPLVTTKSVVPEVVGTATATTEAVTKNVVAAESAGAGLAARAASGFVGAIKGIGKGAIMNVLFEGVHEFFSLRKRDDLTSGQAATEGTVAAVGTGTAAAIGGSIGAAIVAPMAIPLAATGIGAIPAAALEYTAYGLGAWGASSLARPSMERFGAYVAGDTAKNPTSAMDDMIKPISHIFGDSSKGETGNDLLDIANYVAGNENGNRKLAGALPNGRYGTFRDPSGGTDIGYGHQLSSDELRSGQVRINGNPVSFKDGITMEQVRTLLLQDTKERGIDRVKPKLEAAGISWDSLNIDQKKTLTDYAYNGNATTLPAGFIESFKKGDLKTAGGSFVTGSHVNRFEGVNVRHRNEAAAFGGGTVAVASGSSGHGKYLTDHPFSNGKDENTYVSSPRTIINNNYYNSSDGDEDSHPLGGSATPNHTTLG